jgi:rhodanese-related sulfurtransferase
MKPRLCDPRQSREYFEKKLNFTTGPVELDLWLKENKNDIVLVDVRKKEDYEKGHIRGAISLPKDSWATPQGLSKDKLNVVYCYSQSCHLAAAAAMTFASQGYCCMELEGGIETWTKVGFKTESLAAAR